MYVSEKATNILGYGILNIVGRKIMDNELLFSLHRAVSEFRKLDLDKDIDKYHSKENLTICLEQLSKYGCDPQSIYVTDASYNNIFYAEPDNGVYIELYDLSPEMLGMIHLDRISNLRELQFQKWKNRQYSLYYMMIPKPLRIYDFQKHFKSIPKEYLIDTWRNIYTSLDYGFSK